MSCSRHVARSRRSGRCGCRPILTGSRSSRAHRRHPPTAAFSSAGGPNMTTFDAPVAMRVRRSAARTARTAFPTGPSKPAVPTTQDAFHRRVSARPTPLSRGRSRTRTRHRAPRLCRPGPASDALSLRAPEGGGARHGRFRALFAPGRTVPRAARRLLQSKRSASTTDGPSKPRPVVGPLDFRRAPHPEAGPARGGRPR